MTSIGEQFNQLVEAALTVEKSQPHQDDNMLTVDESAKSQDFFHEYKGVGKKYTTTRIKSRNFLSHIAYVGIIKEDYYNENFVFDVYLLLTKNLNLFSLDRKLADKTKHEMIYVLWKECVPTSFYKHICKEHNFLYLKGKNVFEPKVVEKNYKQLRNNLSS